MNKTKNQRFNETIFVDALIIIGTENKPCDLERLSEIVSDDISCNIKVMAFLK